MLKLILGASGTGKTHLISEMIKKNIADGERAILLVPEQETVARERAMLDILPASAQLSFEVLNFSRLSNSVFRRYGGLTYNYVSAPVKSLAIWNTVRALEPLLFEYGKQAKDTSFAELILAQIEEFKAYAVTPAMLERVIEKLPGESTLSGKLKDFSLIYSLYSEFLSEYGAGDASDDIGRLAHTLSKNDFFDGINVYIDSFTSFTKAQENVLSHIIRQAKSTAIALCTDGKRTADTPHFDVVNKTAERVRTIAAECGEDIETLCLSENRRFSGPALTYLSENIWKFGAEPIAEPADTGSVRLIKCRNVYEEAECVAGEISRLVRGGMRYRDIAVIARNAQSYDGIIDSALERADIPFFMSRSSDVISMPLSKLVLSALRIKNRGFRAEDVITYLKTGLCPVNTDDADVFEDYVRHWSINGRAFCGDDWNMHPDKYSYEVEGASREKLDRINETRRRIISPLVSLFEKIDAAKTNKDSCLAIFEFMEELSVSSQMKEFAELCEARGEKESASEALRLYNTVLDALEIIAELDTGDEIYSPSELETALRIVLSKTSMGNIPTSCDEVSVGSASLFRADKPRCVILIGVGEGIFPEYVSESVMLSDAEKALLYEAGLELSGDSALRTSEEFFYVYRAISAASEKLILTYPASELQGGKELLPSTAFERVRNLLAARVIEYSSIPLSERINNVGGAFESFLFTEGNLREALSEYFSTDERYSERLAELETPLCEAECRVSAETSDKVLGRKIGFSPTSLEKYILCHFKYWCEDVLKLRPDEKYEFSFRDVGTLVHALLEEFIKKVTDENGFNPRLSDEELEELLDKIIEAYTEKNIPEKELGRERLRHALYKLSALSKLFVRNIAAELSESSFVPTYFELKINDKDAGAVRPTEYVLPDGSKATLSGIIDRVDVFRDGKEVFIRVVDYKTGEQTFSLSKVKEGLSLQMLLYLFTLCESAENKRLFSCPDGGELVPAGVMYVSSKVSSSQMDIIGDKEKIKEETDKKFTRSGIVLSEEKVLRAMREGGDIKSIITENKDNLTDRKGFLQISELVRDTFVGTVSGLRSGNADMTTRAREKESPCEYCNMKSVCRHSVVNKDEEEGDD